MHLPDIRGVHTQQTSNERQRKEDDCDGSKHIDELAVLLSTHFNRVTRPELGLLCKTMKLFEMLNHVFELRQGSAV